MGKSPEALIRAGILGWESQKCEPFLGLALFGGLLHALRFFAQIVIIRAGTLTTACRSLKFLASLLYLSSTKRWGSRAIFENSASHGHPSRSQRGARWAI